MKIFYRLFVEKKRRTLLGALVVTRRAIVDMQRSLMAVARI